MDFLWMAPADETYLCDVVLCCCYAPVLAVADFFPEDEFTAP